MPPGAAAHGPCPEAPGFRTPPAVTRSDSSQFAAEQLIGEIEANTGKAVMDARGEIVRLVANNLEEFRGLQKGGLSI